MAIPRTPPSDAVRIRRALALLVENWPSQPDLSWLAEQLDLSAFHLQRLFTRWVGISPKRFVQFLTKEAARERLGEAGSLLQTAFECGLSGTARLHDLFVRYEGMTPGEFKAAAAGVPLHEGDIETPFGPAFALWAPRGLNRLEFFNTHEEYEQHRREAITAFPEARWLPLTGVQKSRLRNAFAAKPGADRLSLCVSGTSFQLKVWEALLAIPPGKSVTYSGLANALGVRSTVALGNAVAANALAWLIPCHRVICASGLVGRFRWGVERKRTMLAWEAARAMG